VKRRKEDSDRINFIPSKFTLEKREEDLSWHSFSFDTKSRITPNGRPNSMSTGKNGNLRGAKEVAFFAAKKIQTK
jgi:hypothetical protein